MRHRHLVRPPTFSLLKSDKFVNLYRHLGLETMILSYNDPDVAALLDIPARAVNAVNLAALRTEVKAAMARLRMVMVEESKQKTVLLRLQPAAGNLTQFLHPPASTLLTDPKCRQEQKDYICSGERFDCKQ